MNAVVGAIAFVWLGMVLALSFRRDHVLAGERPSPSPAHLTYIGLECCKLLVLLVLGTSALAAVKS